MKKRQFLALTALSAIATLSLALPAAAQGFPTKPITLIVPYAAGGATDSYSRAFADFVEKKFGAQIIVENRDGAGGTVGTDYAMRQPADGYTLIYTSSSTLQGYLFQGKRIEMGKDLDGVGGIQLSLNVWSVNPQVIDAKTLPEMIQYFKDHPGTSYGTVGVGSTAHLTFEAFAKTNGLEVEHVPYRGSSAVMQALVSGEIGVIAGADAASALPHIKAETIRPIATTGTVRADFLPDMLTVGEQGFPELSYTAFGGFTAPAGLPEDVRATLAGWVEAAMQDETFVGRLVALGTTPSYLSPDEMNKALNDNTDRFARIIADTGITPN